MGKEEFKIKITAKDLAPFVGLPCMIFSGGEPVHHHIEGVDIHTNKVIAERVNYDPEQIKPILRDLECLTIENTVFYSCDIMGYNKGTKKEQKKWHENDLNDIKEYGFIQFHTSDSIWMPKIMEYLTKEGFNLHLLPHGTYLVERKYGKIDHDDICETIGSNDPNYSGWSPEKLEDIKNFCRTRRLSKK